MAVLNFDILQQPNDKYAPFILQHYFVKYFKNKLQNPNFNHS